MNEHETKERKELAGIHITYTVEVSFLTCLATPEQKDQVIVWRRGIEHDVPFHHLLN